MCQNGCSDVVAYRGNESPIRIFGDYKVLHAQCDDGRWICDTCYHYECCVNSKNDPFNGLCGKYKCKHRPKLISEWTFWTYNLGNNSILEFEADEDEVDPLDEDEVDPLDEEEIDSIDEEV
jgi:hypothetical protein